MIAKPIIPASYPWLDYTNYSFSLGLDIETGLFLSGSDASAYDPVRKAVVVKGGMADQARIAYAKIASLLDAGGKTPADVARVVEYVTPAGLAAYADAAGARAEFFGVNRPTVNTVPIDALLLSDALIAIEVVAGTFAPAAVGLPRESAGIIYLPTLLPTDKSGDIVSQGDVVGQTDHILAKAAELLAALGSDLSHVVMTVDFLTEAARKDYRRSGEPRFARLGPIYPGAAGIMQERLLHPDALVQYDIIATRDTPELIDPGWERYKTLSYSAGVRAGKLVFMSGQGAMDPVALDFHHADDIVAQTEFVYHNILKVVATAGGTASNLVKTTEFITPSSIEAYKGVAEVRRRMFRPPYPVSTSVVCKALLKREMRIEVIPFAILD
jgi:enamine deaminase RidA (YjgF/YER057c/UK114 family)